MQSANGRSAIFILTVIASFFVLIFGCFLYAILSQMPNTPQGFDALDKIGSFISGIFSLISVIWISSTFILQMRELQAQREDIKLQAAATMSAAASFRSQLVISIYDKAIETLAITLRDMLVALKFESNLNLSSNNPLQTFQVVSDLSEFFPQVISSFEEDNAIIKALVYQYSNEAKNLAILLSQPSFPAEIKNYLYDLTPIADINQRFDDIYKTEDRNRF